MLNTILRSPLQRTASYRPLALSRSFQLNFVSAFATAHSEAISHSLSTPNLFASFTALANEHNAINLGQGFPTFGTPQFVLDNVTEAVSNQPYNQYSRPGGHPILNETLANFYSSRFNKNLDPLENICTFTGAQGGLFNIIQSFCDPGDEICTIEPYFDAYKKAADVVGAKTIGIPLRSSSPSSSSNSAADYKIDIDELRSTLTPKTKILMLNTPHNPTGKVFSLDELHDIANVVREFPNLLVVSDEVYEFSTFKPLTHHRFATIDGMWDRTISLYSAGKTFSCTGWRIGYAIGSKYLIAPLVAAQGVISFCTATPLEIAVASSMIDGESNGYFDTFSESLSQRQDLFAESLEECGLKPILAGGGYFILADTSGVALPSEYDEERRDFAVAKHLTKEFGVTGIPTSPFYQENNKELSDNVLRFCFARKEEELKEAGKRLKRML
jgi:aspartate/methionine/tyrosine aminotransferase